MGNMLLVVECGSSQPQAPNRNGLRMRVCDAEKCHGSSVCGNAPVRVVRHKPDLKQYNIRSLQASNLNFFPLPAV